MTDPMTLDEIHALSAYELAAIADCLGPDSPSSPGARFLDDVRDDVVRAIKEERITLDDFDDNGQCHEIADAAPSIWTAEKWKQFVDLGAYHEEPEHGDAWPDDLDKAASIALYQIADRLARALCEAWREGWTCPVCGAEVDGDCTDGEDGCGNPAGPLVALVTERLADVEAEAVLTGPVDLPASDPILDLIDRADASDMGIRVTRAAMAHDRAVSRFRRMVWTVAGVLAVIGVLVVMW